MDLIDRSKLKRTEGMFQYQINDAFDRLSASAYRFEDVENAPTVEAIPIEWIEEWLENIKSDQRYKNEYVELTEEVKRIVYRQDIIIKIPCISDMLEDWKKENEIDRC